MELNENISYQLEDNDNEEELVNIEHFLNDFEKIHYNVDNNDPIYAKIINYHFNYNVKQLLLICDYYGFSKVVKINKLKKQDLIEQIVLFESSESNAEIVNKRIKMWYYITALKNDKFMKKYVIWE